LLNLLTFKKITLPPIQSNQCLK